MRKIYGYIRVSTNNQVENGMSLKEQQRQVELYGEVNKMKVDTIFTERGVSASVELRKRPRGAVLLEVVKDGDVIICSKLDRMFRSVLDGLQVLKELKARNIELHFIDLGGNTTTNGIGQLVFTIMSSFAEMERNRLGERIRDTKQSQMKEDVYTGGPIGFGYVLENINENNYLLEAPEEQELIKKMNKMRKDGMSYRKISDEINKEQYMKKNEKSLSHQAISNILKDETKKKQKIKRVKDKIKKSKKK
jgi:putative DNA-invertase from lambdoid prophage Rac